MRLIAKKVFTYAGHNLAVGDPFDATARDAILLIGIGKAKIASQQPDSPVLTDAVENPEPQRVKRKYTKRKPDSERKPYKRRDMEPE